jgi:hypothetical protein
MSDTIGFLKRTTIFALAALLYAGVASAQPGVPQPSAPVATAAPQKPATAPTQIAANQAGQKPPAPPKICRRLAAPIGTRIGARTVCRTAADWRRQESIAKDVADEIQSIGRLSNPVGQ